MTHQLSCLSAQLGKLSLVVSIQLALPLLMLSLVQPLGLLKTLPLQLEVVLPCAHCSLPVKQTPARAISGVRGSMWGWGSRLVTAYLQCIWTTAHADPCVCVWGQGMGGEVSV